MFIRIVVSGKKSGPPLKDLLPVNTETNYTEENHT